MTKSWIEETKNCKKHIRIIALWMYCILSYPFNYFAMDNGWGFYDKNPQVTATEFEGDDGEWSEGEIIFNRMALFVMSPLATPTNGIYMIVESVTHIEE